MKGGSVPEEGCIAGLSLSRLASGMDPGGQKIDLFPYEVSGETLLTRIILCGNVLKNVFIVLGKHERAVQPVGSVLFVRSVRDRSDSWSIPPSTSHGVDKIARRGC